VAVNIDISFFRANGQSFQWQVTRQVGDIFHGEEQKNLKSQDDDGMWGCDSQIRSFRRGTEPWKRGGEAETPVEEGGQESCSSSLRGTA
jgi:hypothetical protein